MKQEGAIVQGRILSCSEQSALVWLDNCGDDGLFVLQRSAITSASVSDCACSMMPDAENIKVQLLRVSKKHFARIVQH